MFRSARPVTADRLDPGLGRVECHYQPRPRDGVVAEQSRARMAQRRLDLQIEKMTQRLFTNAVK
jgi:hypothetical protein